MDNIILIGMPGCGKSTVGVLLAKLLGFGFLDCDLIIQHTEGKKLYEILRDKGPDYFSKLENSVNANLMAHKTVIATGGSVVYGKEAMEHLREIGTVVYLKVSLKELERRVNNFSTRGIVMNDGQTLGDIFEERSPLYEKYADITVNCSRGSLQKNAEKIYEALTPSV
jgi:shikimate kinase